jgi:hypothetical protein
MTVIDQSVAAGGFAAIVDITERSAAVVRR